MSNTIKRTAPNISAEQFKKPRVTIHQYFMDHLHACISSFGAMSRAPFASMMTLAVIGIALALPFGLFVMLDNIQLLTKDWNNSAQISLYLKSNVTLTGAENLQNALLVRDDVAKVRLITPQEGLQEFESYSGFQNVLAELEDNPLPIVLEIQPHGEQHSALALQQLLQSLKSLPEVETAKFDMAWVKRFYSMINLGRQMVMGLAILLGLGVILIIGNTIRLNTGSHKADIEVYKLVGATDAYIRRPFLYSGILYGAIGAIIAMVMIESFITWLVPPVQHLARLYHNHFHLQGLNNHGILMLITTGAMAGFLGSWLAVSKHLRDSRPNV